MRCSCLLAPPFCHVLFRCGLGRRHGYGEHPPDPRQTAPQGRQTVWLGVGGGLGSTYLRECGLEHPTTSAPVLDGGRGVWCGELVVAGKRILPVKTPKNNKSSTTQKRENQKSEHVAIA